MKQIHNKKTKILFTTFVLVCLVLLFGILLVDNNGVDDQNNSYIKNMTDCFSEYLIEESEIDSAIQSGNFDILNPPQECRREMDLFVSDCIKNGKSMDECSTEYAATWVVMNDEYNHRTLEIIKITRGILKNIK